MKYLHYDFYLNTGDAVNVVLDKQANVRLMDDANFSKYRRRQRHTYYGGRATQSPVIIRAPYSGNWHLVVDLGGYPGTIRASVSTTTI